MDTHANSQPSMQSLLHSSPPPGDDQDILHRQPSGVYIHSNDHPGISYNAWTFNAHSPASLERKLEHLVELRLPPATGIDNSSSIARFMTDDTSSRPLVELDVNASGSINNGFLGHAHNPHLSIATSWNGYQSSYHESADASSAVSSLYEYSSYPAATETASTSAWTGSPGDHHFRDVDYILGNTSPTSPIYNHESPRRRGHSSMEGCLSPSSPGLNETQQTWRRASPYSTASNSGNNSPGEAPEATGTETCLASQGSYVSLKSIQFAPAEEERDEDRDDAGAEEGRSNRNSIPYIRFHGPEHTSSWCHEQGQYYMQTPMEIECSTPSPCPSPPTLLQRSTLEARKERHQRSGSGASQLSVKEREELMKPHKDVASKSHKGRGAGKRQKERQRCSEHPNKSFRHNSDFRYSPPPPCQLPLSVPEPIN